jgi:hypothetical protein
MAEAIQVYRSAGGATRASVTWKRFLINRHFFALWAWRRRKTSKMTIQEFIQGRPATTMFACWKGEVLASTTVEVLVSQGATGAATVVRVLVSDEIEDAARRLAREFRLSGFCGLDFVLEKGTGTAYLIELNPRATQLGHLNLSAYGDLAGVMAAKLRNEIPSTAASENCIGDRIIAFFPYAFKSHPKISRMSQLYLDVPWDEPALVRELAYDPWPDRQWLSRIYYCFRARKQPDTEHEDFRPINSKSHA